MFHSHDVPFHTYTGSQRGGQLLALSGVLAFSCENSAASVVCPGARTALFQADICRRRRLSITVPFNPTPAILEESAPFDLTIRGRVHIDIDPPPAVRCATQIRCSGWRQSAGAVAHETRTDQLEQRHRRWQRQRDQEQAQAPAHSQPQQPRQQHGHKGTATNKL
ncbi:uncharacterized protein LOC113564918 [Drosophila persimilis]|uniref:uncharacterized protein LOC113564918 n=1 Tax=Drosophila persimilis TaxID=7234 RepID=UPI000F081DF1|nr:uncharacterized protein LOC113564918 [Drosophila persimilis]